ncbi:hypothetical protein [Paenibacillus chibensis]|uniref:hypothetical protein n=1 Tax=Paenibacillus chibensis TaxID=59846 RepID=UPI000FDA973D|nr:hypothetical protein [Paenibacillus chibensis]MEC0370799.1 hypothetical protein [Paenibacillus chibensis]
MKVTIDNHEAQYLAHDIEAINEWWKKSTSQIYNQKRLIYCLEIDGVKMYTGYESVIVNNYNNIDKIEIMTKGYEESICETLQEMGLYLKVFIPRSLIIADYFFGEVSEEAWGEFSKFIDGLNWIISSLEFIQTISDPCNDAVELVLRKLEPVVANLEQSIRNGDHVDVADLIKYELIPIIEPLQQICGIQQGD